MPLPSPPDRDQGRHLDAPASLGARLPVKRDRMLTGPQARVDRRWLTIPVSLVDIDAPLEGQGDLEGAVVDQYDLAVAAVMLHLGVIEVDTGDVGVRADAQHRPLGLDDQVEVVLPAHTMFE